jgi:hypothetical protein
MAVLGVTAWDACQTDDSTLSGAFMPVSQGRNARFPGAFAPCVMKVHGLSFPAGRQS